MQTDWFKYSTKYSARFLEVPKLLKSDPHLGTFDDLIYMSLITATKDFKRAIKKDADAYQGFITRTEYTIDSVLTTKHYYFVRDLDRLLKRFKNIGYFGLQYCYDIQNYVSIEVLPGLNMTQLHDLVAGYTHTEKLSLRGNYVDKNLFLNTALYSSSTHGWYLAQSPLQGGVGKATVRRMEV